MYLKTTDSILEFALRCADAKNNIYIYNLGHGNKSSKIGWGQYVSIGLDQNMALDIHVYIYTYIYTCIYMYIYIYIFIPIFDRTVKQPTELRVSSIYNMNSLHYFLLPLN